MNKSLASLLVIGLSVASMAPAAAPGGGASSSATSVVLIHGAFADGSGWNKVIPPLEDDGYGVTAVQLPLTSFADDVATARRVIDAQPGPVVVVGHSYGGAVMTRAAHGAAGVKALVYVAAFGPDEGEAMSGLLAQYPSSIGAALVPDAAGFLSIDRSKFSAVFAADVTAVERRVMAATQKPIAGAIFEQVHGVPAWRTIPSWYLVATNDQAINPDLQRLFAKRMKASVTEIPASHVPFVSRPEAVVAIIESAARAASASGVASASQGAGR